MYRFTFIIFFITLLIFSCKQKKESKNKIPPVQIDFKNKDTLPVTYDDSIKISYSYGFGMCTGFCEAIFEIHSNTIVRTEKQYISKNNEPVNAKRVKTIAINPKDYKSLVSTFTANFFNLPDKIGCPDCNDSGWAKITLSIGSKSKTVNYPYGERIPEIEFFQNKLMEISSAKKFLVE